MVDTWVTSHNVMDVQFTSGRELFRDEKPQGRYMPLETVEAEYIRNSWDCELQFYTWNECLCDTLERAADMTRKPLHANRRNRTPDGSMPTSIDLGRDFCSWEAYKHVLVYAQWSLCYTFVKRQVHPQFFTEMYLPVRQNSPPIEIHLAGFEEIHDSDSLHSAMNPYRRGVQR